MRNLLLVIFTLSSLVSCSFITSKSVKPEYKQHYIVKKPSEVKDSPKPISLKHDKYENQNGYFDDLFDWDGHYIGYSKIGAKYIIKGKTYTPKNYKKYQETGIASWYGDAFHGKKTANGEIFNAKSVTAAHRTLPLPSMVRVTNLKNGKMIMARVNDRGPFAGDRIIDLSRKSASLLGFKKQGVAKVKVELLPDETNELLKQLNIKR